MKGILNFVGLNLGGVVGWYLGIWHGIMLAVVLSAIGSGVGLYAIRKLSARYLE